MESAPYKQYQQLYNELVTEHPDDFANMQIVEEEELVENALKYFKAAEFPLIYPAKSYAVGIIYAHTLHGLYGLPVRDILDDPDLFLGQDEFFVPYSQNPAVYDAIMARLAHMPGWITSGWAPQTVKYCLLECTEEGIASLTENGY